MLLDAGSLTAGFETVSCAASRDGSRSGAVDANPVGPKNLIDSRHGANQILSRCN
jgi:hypothetical protein